MIRCLAILFLFTCAAQAQEPLTIKLKERGEGETVLCTRTEIRVFRFKLTDGKGKDLKEQTQSKAEITEYKETVLKREGKTPAAKLQREYAKAQIKSGGKTIDSPLQGMTVFIEKKADKYSFTYKDAGEVAGEPAARLAKEFSPRPEEAEFRNLVLPKTAVKAGESWKLNMPPLLKLLSLDGEIEIDAVKAAGSGVLTKVYRKEDRQFGEMKFQVEAPLKSLGKGAQKRTFTGAAMMNLDALLDLCIDGALESSTLRMKLTIKGKAVVPQVPGGAMTIDDVWESLHTRQETAKK